MKTIIKHHTVKLVKEAAHKYELNSAYIRSPRDAGDAFTEVMKPDELTKEHLMLMCLNTKNKITSMQIVHVGSLNASIVHPRDLFQVAILDNAASIIIAHNHPSGDTTPSMEDSQVTKRIAEAGKIMGIELLDHVIIGDRNYSFKEQGKL